MNGEDHVQAYTYRPKYALAMDRGTIRWVCTHREEVVSTTVEWRTNSPSQLGQRRRTDPRLTGRHPLPHHHQHHGACSLSRYVRRWMSFCACPVVISVSIEGSRRDVATSHQLLFFVLIVLGASGRSVVALDRTWHLTAVHLLIVRRVEQRREHVMLVLAGPRCYVVGILLDWLGLTR